MTAKTVNYTPEQTAQMVADYQAGTTVETIAEALGKTVRSVVAKLSREKVYVAKTYVSKTGEAVVKKTRLQTTLHRPWVWVKRMRIRLPRQTKLH